MTNRIVLGLDADGVLLNYLEGFIRFCRLSGYVVHCEAHEVSDWSMKTAFGHDKSDEWVRERIEEFSTSIEFSKIPFLPGAVDAIHHLKSLRDDVDVVIVTSAGTSAETANLRRINLEAFPVDDIHVLPLGANKTEHLSKFPSGSLFVDDLYKHVQAAESVGVKGVLFRQPYNVADNHDPVIKCWNEGIAAISGLLIPSLKVA